MSFGSDNNLFFYGLNNYFVVFDYPFDGQLLFSDSSFFLRVSKGVFSFLKLKDGNVCVCADLQGSNFVVLTQDFCRREGAGFNYFVERPA